MATHSFQWSVLDAKNRHILNKLSCNFNKNKVCEPVREISKLGCVQRNLSNRRQYIKSLRLNSFLLKDSEAI